MQTITSTDIPPVANMSKLEREALTAVGITNRRQRIAMQGHLASLIER